jgi:hypothetical protein
VVGRSGRVFAQEELAVVAAEEEGEAVQVGADCVQSVGGVADVGQERWGEGGGVGGEPAGDELGVSASSMASAVSMQVRGMAVPVADLPREQCRPWWLHRTRPGVGPYADSYTGRPQGRR